MTGFSVFAPGTPGPRETALGAPTRFGVVGTSHHALSLAITVAGHGCTVVVACDRSQEEHARGHVMAVLSRALQHGATTEERVAHILRRISFTDVSASLGRSELLFVEAPGSAEDATAWAHRLADLELLLEDPEATLLVEAGRQPLSTVAASASCPARVVGVRLREPVDALEQVEIIAAPSSGATHALNAASFFSSVLGRQVVPGQERPRSPRVEAPVGSVAERLRSRSLLRIGRALQHAPTPPAGWWTHALVLTSVASIAWACLAMGVDPGVTVLGCATLAGLASTLLTGRAERLRTATAVETETRSLAESERQFRLVAEYAGDVVIRHRVLQRAAWVSPAVTRTLGWRPEDLVDRHIVELVHPEDRAEVERQVRRLSSGDQRTAFEARIRTALGGYRWMQATMTYTGKPGRSEAVSVWRDIEHTVEARRLAAEHDADRRATEHRLRASLEVVPIGIARYALTVADSDLSQEFVLEYLNAHGRETFGNEGVLLGAAVSELFTPTDDTDLLAVMGESLATSQARTFTTKVTIAGQDRVLDVALGPVDDQTLVVAWQDVTSRVTSAALLAAAYEETAQARVLLDLALDSVAEPFYVWEVSPADASRTTLSMVNPAGADHWSLTPAEATGQGLADLHDEAEALRLHELFGQAIQAGVAVQAPDLQRPAPGSAGERIWRPMLSPMSENLVAMVLHDVTSEVRAAERLQRERDRAERSARVDVLTGLLNRRGLDEELDAAWAAADPWTQFAVVYVDLDRFKQVNDTYGHDAGDVVLVSVANRLRSLCRGGDVTARPGGDEFVLILNGLDLDWDASACRHRIQEQIARPVTLPSGAVITPQASVGAVTSLEATEAEGLFSAADRAMYEDKRVRRGAPVLLGAVDGVVGE